MGSWLVVLYVVRVNFLKFLEAYLFHLIVTIKLYVFFMNAIICILVSLHFKSFLFVILMFPCLCQNTDYLRLNNYIINSSNDCELEKSLAIIRIRYIVSSLFVMSLIFLVLNGNCNFRMK